MDTTKVPGTRTRTPAMCLAPVSGFILLSLRVSLAKFELTGVMPHQGIGEFSNTVSVDIQIQMKDPLDFRRTLILGASVSAAPDDRNPAKRFLRQHLNGAPKVISHAQNGAPGAKMLSCLKKSILSEVSAVITVDLLFWDSVMGLGEPRESRAFLRGFLKEISERRLPLVIGKIPRFHPLQIHCEELNEAIEKEAASCPSVIVLPLDQVFRSVSQNGGITIDGTSHGLRDLLPDGLHPGPVAAEYIARCIANEVRARHGQVVDKLELFSETSSGSAS